MHILPLFFDTQKRLFFCMPSYTFTEPNSKTIKAHEIDLMLSFMQGVSSLVKKKKKKKDRSSQNPFSLPHLSSSSRVFSFVEMISGCVATWYSSVAILLLWSVYHQPRRPPCWSDENKKQALFLLPTKRHHYSSPQSHHYLPRASGFAVASA